MSVSPIGAPNFLAGAADPTALTQDRGDAPIVPDPGDGATNQAGGGTNADPEPAQTPTNNGGTGNGNGNSTQNTGTQGPNAGAGQNAGTGAPGGQNTMGALGGPAWAPGSSLPGGPNGFPGQGLHRGHNPDNPPPGQGHGHHGDENDGNGVRPGKGGENETGRTGRPENQGQAAETTGRTPPTGADAITRPLTNVIDQTGRIISQLGSALLGNDRAAAGNPLHSPVDTSQRTDSGANPARIGQGGQGNGTGDPARLAGESVPRGMTRTDGATLPRGAEGANPQAGTNGRAAGTQIPGGTTPAAAQNAQQSGQQTQAGPQQPAGQQAALLRDGLLATAAQSLLGGLATAGQAAQPQGTLPQNAAQPQPQVLDPRAMPQGNPLAQANATPQQAALQEKPQTLPQQQTPQQNATRGDKELRNPQQMPGEARQRQEAGSTDRALTRQSTEQQARTLADARNAEAQAKAKGLRDGTDARRTGLAENTRPTIGENTRRNELAGTERRQQAGAMASLRHALDWVGQQARGIGADARTDEEGATTMRVVAGLVVAAVFVGVAIGVLYALRVAFVP